MRHVEPVAQDPHAAGWALAPNGSTAQLADVNGDGRADLCARGPEGIVCAEADAAGAFGTLQNWSASHPLPAEEPVPRSKMTRPSLVVTFATR